MISWFKKKQEQIQEIILSGRVGTLSVPANFIIKEDDDTTVLAYPPGPETITLRFSSISFSKSDDDENAGRVFIKGKAKEEGFNYYEIKDKGVLSYERESQDGDTPLIVQYWEVGALNTIVIISATIIKAKQNDKTVKMTLQAIPAMLKSLKVTKVSKIIQGADGKEVDVTVETVEPIPQTVAILGDADIDWLKTNLDRARALGLKYASGGELGPEELDQVFSRWMQESKEKEQPAYIANALGAAFGVYLVQHHDFEWVIVMDEYGSEYAVQHQTKDSIAFPKASVEKRIEDEVPEFFQNLYLLILDTTEKSGERVA